MSDPDTLQPFWSDLRFKFRAESLEGAFDEVDVLIEAAEKLGFEFKLGNTTDVRPVDGPFQ